jgi:phage terminase large subunit
LRGIVAVLDLNNLFPSPSKLSIKRGPLPKQQEFLNTLLDKNAAKFVGYVGGMGSGKSFILCAAMLTQGILYGGEYVIARQFMPELRRTTFKQFADLVPKELLVEHRVADAEIHVKSAAGKPAVFYFVGLDDADKLRSLNLSGFAIDEATQVSEEAFLLLQSRLRNPKGLRKGILVGNPAGHDWVWRYFVSQRDFNTEAAKRDYKMIVAPSTENVHLPEGYVESMLANYSKERVQRDIMGSFDSFEGMIFSEFQRNVHVIKPFAIPEGWTKIIGADHGFRNPSAWVWVAIDYDGTAFVYREFYEREWLVQEIVKGHKKLGKPGVVTLTGKEKVEGAFLDPSTKAVRGQTGASDWDTYLEHLPQDFPLLPAKNDVTAGIDRVKSYMKLHERSGKPRLYIFDTCVNLLDEISQYKYQENMAGQQGTKNEKEAPVKKNDHAVDALRYALMSRPETPVVQDDHKMSPHGTMERSLQDELAAIKRPKVKDPFGDGI